MVRKLVLMCLFVFLLLAAFYTWRPKWSVRSQVTPAPPPSAQKAMAPLPPAQVPSEPEKHSELLAWGRNPFLTPEEEGKELAPKGATTASLMPSNPNIVSAIILQGSRKVATVNNQIVMVGDLLGEEKVLDIKVDRVVLERNGKRREILLRQSPISITVHPPKRGGW